MELINATGFATEDTIEKILKEYHFSSKKEYQDAFRLHKNRIFDPNSYYYYTCGDYPQALPYEKGLLLNDSFNKLLNSILQYQEVSLVKKYVEENKPKNVEKDVIKQKQVKSRVDTKIFDLKEYIEKKQAVIDNKEVKEAIFPKTVQTEFK